MTISYIEIGQCRTIDQLEVATMQDYRPENHACGAGSIVSAWALVVPVISVVSVAMIL